MKRFWGRARRGAPDAPDVPDAPAARAGLEARYLDLLASALLDEQYLEHEVRLDHLLQQPQLAGIDLTPLRDPARTMGMRYGARLASRRRGEPPWSVPFPPYAVEGRALLDQVAASVAAVAERGVPGDVVELGTARGGVAVLARAALDVHGLADRLVWVVGPFPATDPDAAGGAPAEQAGAFRADLHQVRDAFDRFGVGTDGVRLLEGEALDALADAPLGQIALLRVGGVPIREVRPLLDRLLPATADGAELIVATGGEDLLVRAVDDALAGAGIRGRSRPVDHRHRAWALQRDTPPGPPPSGARPGRPLRRAAVPAPVRAVAGDEREPLDLSVVVVFFDMAREARRTLHSLSRAYQRGIEDLRYEVIAVDNGSSPEQRLRAADVEAHGPEFRLLDLAGSATPSPTTAMNAGIREARGEVVALMIDGAHVLTPGVLRHAMTGMAAYDPAVVAVQQWYVGPGQQGDAQRLGYDQEAEDRLFRSINWPTDGYRLFEIGHFIGNRDWLDGMAESNCLFAPRRLLEQVGAYDDSFDVAGGGFANLELFERLLHHPGVTFTTVLGEGSFHQVHGGTTTNIAADAERRRTTASYAADFEALRGRRLLGADKDMHYVGALATAAARRTRPRWAMAIRPDPDRDPVGSTPTTPEIVADDVRSAAAHAAWTSQSWRQATWLGHRVNRYPSDLHLYQELVAAAEAPDVVLVADDDGLGGRARFFATVLDQLDRGRLLVVGAVDDEVAAHPRTTVLPAGAEGWEAAAALAGEAGASAFIGLGAADRVIAAFEALAPAVPVGGWAVIETTVLNGYPVVPEFGPGPHEAVVDILTRHHDWAADRSVERELVTFNPGGYLRRIS